MKNMKLGLLHELRNPTRLQGMAGYFLDCLFVNMLSHLKHGLGSLITPSGIDRTWKLSSGIHLDERNS